MYNVSMHAQQILGATILAVSLTETTDGGITYPLATAMSSSNLLSSADEDELWIFLQQIRDCLSRALGDETGLWFQLNESAEVDGGWRGAGSSGSSSDSENDHA
jgi:hypothetical protein